MHRCSCGADRGGRCTRKSVLPAPEICADHDQCPANMPPTAASSDSMLKPVSSESGRLRPCSHYAGTEGNEAAEGASSTSNSRSMDSTSRNLGNGFTDDFGDVHWRFSQLLNLLMSG